MRTGHSKQATNALQIALEALARSNGAGQSSAAASTRVNGANAAPIVTGSIPAPESLAGMVVVCHATTTPKVTGKFRVRFILQTSINGNGAAQGVQASIGHSSLAPVDGVTTQNADVTVATPPTPVAINGSASLVYDLFYTGGPGSNTGAGPFPLGTPVSFAGMLTQSVAGAFSVPTQGAQIEVDELLE